jgi:GNAT superfamily N-acetyltransferase
MQLDEAPVVAEQHAEGIPGGFLSSLGPRFLADLYRNLARSREAFVLVSVDEENAVTGFLAATTQLKKAYRSVLIRRGWLYVFLLARHFLNPSSIRRIFQTTNYMDRDKSELPDAELLSIVVTPKSRGTGAASALFDEMVAEYHRRGVYKFKILVGAQLERANAYYQKLGCELVATIESHGVPSNVYVYEIAKE